MGTCNTIISILGAIFIPGVLVFVFVSKTKDEEKTYKSFSKSADIPSGAIRPYRAIKETDMSTIYKTNFVHVFFDEENITVQKSGFVKGKFNLVFNKNNTVSVEIEKIDSVKSYIVIYHTHDGLKSPLNLRVLSKIIDEDLTTINKFNGNITK